MLEYAYSGAINLVCRFTPFSLFMCDLNELNMFTVVCVNVVYHLTNSALGVDAPSLWQPLRP